MTAAPPDQLTLDRIETPIGTALVVTDDKGVVTPEPGTKEAFQKYLDLKPDGPYAESSKGMLAMLGGQIATEYKNPAAPKKGVKKK